MTGYRFGPGVREDLAGIWEYIAPDNPEAADEFLDTLYAQFDQLAAFPRLGHPRPDLAHTRPFLFWPVRNYLIIYRIQRDVVEIIAGTPRRPRHPHIPPRPRRALTRLQRPAPPDRMRASGHFRYMSDALLTGWNNYGGLRQGLREEGREGLCHGRRGGMPAIPAGAVSPSWERARSCLLSPPAQETRDHPRAAPNSSPWRLQGARCLSFHSGVRDLTRAGSLLGCKPPPPAIEP